MKIKNVESSKVKFGLNEYEKIAQLTNTPVKKIKRVMKKERKFLLEGNESGIVPKGVTELSKIARFFLAAYKEAL